MTTKFALFPAPNRNLNQIADHDGYGCFAYGCRGCIYVLDLKSSLPVVLDSSVIRNGHRGKVLSISLCKSDGNKLLASVGEDQVIKIWDLKTATCIASLEVKESAQIVEWLCETTNVVVYPDMGGIISKWNFTTNNSAKIKTGSGVITAISSNPKQPELLAVGHSVGTVSVLNVNNQTCIKNLKTHSLEINSLSWSPISPSTLLSTSLDQSARIWNLQDDKPVHTYYYPTARYKAEDKKNYKICSIFHPDNPDVIICSNVRGNVGSVQFSENEVPKFTPYSTEGFDNHYFKTIFQMMPYVDVTGQNKRILLTFDPTKLALWNISDQKLLSQCYSIHGNVFDIAVCPVAQNLMAVGIGDGFLKILSMDSEENMEVSSIYVNLRMKIMSVSWHPTDENIIAYGSDEGRVGIVDVSRKKIMHSFETHHTNAVYSLQWGPCSKFADSKETYFLYSCGGGIILIRELSKSKEKPVDFGSLVNTLDSDHSNYSEICWKPDYSCLAVGTYKGFVFFYNDKFELLCQFSLQLKNLEILKWHPMHTFSSSMESSKFSSWLAAVGNDENIHIIDASDFLNQRPGGLPLIKPTKTLVGHKKRISALCWSPHTDGHLLSGARDGYVQVWNVITGTPIANYMWHRENIYAVQWSFGNQDIVYSGGTENCLRVWRISEQKQSEIPAKPFITRHKAIKDKRKCPSEGKTESGVFNSSVNGTLESKADFTETSKEPEVLHVTRNDSGQTKPYCDGLRDLDRKGGVFNLKNSKEESFKNIFKLVDLLCDESVSNTENSEPVADKIASEDLLNLGFFIDQNTALKMIETKGNIDINHGRKDKAAFCQVMAGNVPKLLTDAAEKKQLTDFLVSISPSVSHKFWLSMCEKYAEQLIEEQRYIKSSLYFVLCGKLYDALRTLSQNGKLLDALALAKARLPESDPFIKNLLCKISGQFGVRKEVENEAVCYIALKNPLHAAKVMNCGGDAKYAYASVYICNKFNLPEATQEYAVICVEKCLSQNDWPTFYKVAEIVESVKVYKILVRVHEIIASQIKALKKEEAAVASEIFGVTGSKILIWNGKTPENSNLSFLAHIHDVLKSEGLLPDDKEILQSIREALNSMETKEKSKVHVNVAIYVCQIIIISLLDDLSSATKYFEKIFHCSYNVVYMPKVICWIFFPLDLYWCSNKNTFLCEIKKMDTVAVPFALHFENIFNSVCNKFECTDMTNSELCIANPDIMTSIEVVQLILTLLSKKTVEDSLLLYFSSQYLNELERIARKGYRFRCYEKDAVYDITPEVNAYTYNFESRRWTRNSDANVEESVSLENAIKHAEQSGFQLPACENTTESANQNVSSITDVITQVFSSEIDSISKDELVQRYGFKHVSDFLQKVMTCEETTSNLENQISVELSSVENTNGQITECTEDEYLHAQCWTDISLYYVLTKSFFSIICRDEYALLYYLKKYLLSLDTKIADLVRLQSANNSNQKPSASKVTLTSNQEKKPGVVIQSEKCLNSFENNSSESLSTDSILKDADSKDIVLNVSKLESWVNVNNEAVTLEEGEVNLCHENERVKLENEIDLVNENKLPGENPDNLPAESNTDCENASYVIGESETKPIDVIVSNDNAILDNAVIFSNKNGEEKLKTENEFDLLNEKERKKGNVIGERETKPIDVIISNDNVISDNAVIFSNRNGEEKLKTENELDLQNEKERKGSFTCINSDRTTDCDSNDCDIKMNELQHRSDSIQDKLRTQYERISGHIKLLELEEFWYPDPFVSVTDLRSICFNIFHKHPCTLIKNKFHELVHEVDLWCSRYSFIEEPEICKICQKVSA